MRARLRDLLLSVGALGLFALGVPAAAQNGAQNEREAWEQYHDAVAEETQLQTDYKQSVQLVAALALRLKELAQEIETAKAELAENALKAAEAQAQHVAGEVRLSALQTRLVDETRRLQNQTVAAYMGGGSTKTAELFAMLRSSTPSEFASSREYAGTVVEFQNELVDSVTQLAVKLPNLRRSWPARATRPVRGGSGA